MVSKKKKKKRSSPKLRLIFRPKSEIQTFFSPKFRWSPKKKKKKKKKVFTKIETDFSPDWLRLGRWGEMHPEMEPIYSKQRLIFRPKSLLLGWWGGMHPPHPPPPKSATNCNPLEDLPWRFLFFMKITNLGAHVWSGGSDFLNSNAIIYSMSISLVNLFF